jgi:hypothetical protein
MDHVLVCPLYLRSSVKLYICCILYMIICAFDSPPQFQISWQHRLFTLDMDSLKKIYSFSFYLSIAVLLVFLCRIAANKSVLLLYACAHKISLKYLIEKIAIEICCQKCFVWQTFFHWISRVCQIRNIKYIHNLRYHETIV